MKQPPDRTPGKETAGIGDSGTREMAHDVNQLLSSVLGRVQLLLERDLDLPVRRHLKLVETAAQDAASIVGRALDGSSEGSPDGLLTAGPLDLRETIATSLELTENLRRSGPGGPRWLIDNAVPAGMYVSADAASLREILTNLIHNAIEAMPDGGGLGFSAFQEGETVVLLVSDEGCGLDAETASKVFRPGFTRGKADGHGIGLAVCRRIIRELGGEISVVPKDEAGATFRLELPVAVVRQPSRSLRILVIDDEAQVREMLFDVLSNDGHRMTLAADAGQGLSAFRPGAFDLVCLDMKMPGVDGLKVARAIRGRDPQVAVALMTGWGREKDGPDLDRSVFDFFVAKPLDLLILRKLVDDATHLGDVRRGRSAEA